MPHTRSRNGCLTCRRDGYKCDELRPTCSRCNRLDKTCEGYGVQLKWREVKPKGPGRSGSRSGGTRQRSPARGGQQMEQLQVAAPLEVLPDSSPQDRLVLHHWMTVLAAMVSMAPGPRNPFLTELTPLIVESPALRSVVSSMAATHLHLLQHDSALQVAGEAHRLRAVAGLRQTIEKGDTEMSLAIILMLQISDRLFTEDSPADHLAGARAIIATKGSGNSSTSSSTSAFLLGLYFYHDVLASVSKGSSPDLRLGDVTIEGMSSLQRLTLILRVVGQISEMRGISPMDPRHEDTGIEIQSTLDALEDTGADDDIRQTAEAYRHAAFVYLYRTWYNIGAPHALTLGHADACLRLLSGIPTTSALQSAHVWPLWTAGCESIDSDHREFVRARLDSMFQLRRLPSLQRIRSDIDEVWSVKDARRHSTGTDEVDCIKAILANRNRAADII